MSGETVKFEAQPEEGYEFVGWEGDIKSEDPVIEFDMQDESIHIEAVFEIETYEVEVSTDNADVEGAGDYHLGDEVTLKISPEEGYKFHKWQGDYTGENETITFEMPAKDVSLEGHVKPRMYTVDVKVENGSVDGAEEYSKGEQVTLTVDVDENYEFLGWQGDFESEDNTLTFEMPAEDVSIQADTEIQQYTFSATADNGTVEGEGQYSVGEEVTATVDPDSGYSFIAWEGDYTGGDNTLTFEMPSNDVQVNAIIKSEDEMEDEKYLQDISSIMATYEQDQIIINNLLENKTYSDLNDANWLQAYFNLEERFNIYMNEVESMEVPDAYREFHDMFIISLEQFDLAIESMNNGIYYYDTIYLYDADMYAGFASDYYDTAWDLFVEMT